MEKRGSHAKLGRMEWQSPFLNFPDQTVGDLSVVVRLEFAQDGHAAPSEFALSEDLENLADFISDLEKRIDDAKAHLAENAAPTLGQIEVYQVLMHVGPNIQFASEISDPFERRFATPGRFSLYFKLRDNVAQEAMASSSLSIAFDDTFHVIGWPMVDDYRFEALPKFKPNKPKVTSSQHAWFGELNDLSYAELAEGALNDQTYRRVLSVPEIHLYGFEATSLDAAAKLDQNLCEIDRSARADITKTLREEWILDRVATAETDIERDQIREIFPNAFRSSITDAEFEKVLRLERVGYYPFAKDDCILVLDYFLLDRTIDDLILVARINADGSIAETVFES